MKCYWDQTEECKFPKNREMDEKEASELEGCLSLVSAYKLCSLCLMGELVKQIKWMSARSK